MLPTLLKLQQTLNTNIDKYAQLSQQPQPDPAQLETLQGQINASSNKLQLATMVPSQEVLRLGLAPSINVAVRVAIDLDLFNVIREPITVEELAKKVGAEPALLLRILRHLSASGYLSERAANTFSPNHMTSTFTTPSHRDWIKTTFDSGLARYEAVPSFLASTHYTNPQSLSHTPVRQTLGTDYFGYLSSHPAEQATFDSAMSITDRMPPALKPSFPYDLALQSRPVSPQSPNSILLIDIGGGYGQALLASLSSHPNLRSSGRLILQDLTSTIATLRKSSPNAPFETASHDFFTPQPPQFHASRFYHLRRVLHDWPDPACHTILSHIASAMRPGYSTLLINEFVLREQGVTQPEAGLDINMLTFGGIERNESQWRALLKGVGLGVRKVWRARVGSTAVIEAELMEGMGEGPRL